MSHPVVFRSCQDVIFDARRKMSKPHPVLLVIFQMNLVVSWLLPVFLYLFQWTLAQISWARCPPVTQPSVSKHWTKLRELIPNHGKLPTHCFILSSCTTGLLDKTSVASFPFLSFWCMNLWQCQSIGGRIDDACCVCLIVVLHVLSDLETGTVTSFAAGESMSAWLMLCCCILAFFCCCVIWLLTVILSLCIW